MSAWSDIARLDKDHSFLERVCWPYDKYPDMPELKAGAQIVLLDADNLVCLHREVTFSLEDSRQIRASLRRQQEVEFHEGEFDVNASGLMSALEPFEMQPMAQVHAVFGASAK